MFRRDLFSPKMSMLVTKRENANRCLFRRNLSPCRRNDEFVIQVMRGFCALIRYSLLALDGPPTVLLPVACRCDGFRAHHWFGKILYFRAHCLGRRIP